MKHYSLRKIMGYVTYRIKEIIGARGYGKTVACKRLVFNEFFKTGKRFIWLRDSTGATESVQALEGVKFFEDMKRTFEEFKNLNGYISGSGGIYINEQLAGYLMAASTFYNDKGTAYPDVKYIIYDEFIPEKAQRTNIWRTTQFINTLETVCRLDPNKIAILTANALDPDDEILNLGGFNITGFGFYKNRERGIVVEYCESSDEYKKAHDKSIVGKLIKGTEIGDVILENKFSATSNDYYDVLPKGTKQIISLYINGNFIDIKRVRSTFYCVRGTQKSQTFVRKVCKCPTTTRILPKDRLETLRTLFNNKSIKFQSVNIRNIFMNFIL